MPPRLQTGRRPRPPAALQRELDGRLAAVQSAMRETGMDLLAFVCAGTSSRAGWVRYLTGAPLWGPRAFVVLRPDHPRRTLITRSPDDANWYRLATVGTDVESTLMQKANPVDRLVAHVEAAPGARVALVHPDALSPLEVEALRGVTFDDVTDVAMRWRQVKSPFELAAMRETGRLLRRGLDRFAAVARPGGLVTEALGEVDGLLRAGGC